jgi:hypothetical protein
MTTQEVDGAEEDGVDVGEVDREDCVGLCGEELSPCWPGSPWSGIDARGLKIFHTVDAATG